MKDVLERCRKLMLQSGADYGAVLRDIQENNKERLSKATLQFTRTCEKLAFAAREISGAFTVCRPGIFSDDPSELGDILFPCGLSDDGIFHIRLPMFSHRARPEKTLLHPIIEKTLALYFAKYDKEHGLHRRYERGTLAFIFSFAGDEAGYDIDNFNDMEYKKTSDDIVSYFLPDDNAFRCSRFHMAQKSNITCVDSYFIPNGMFPRWMQRTNVLQNVTTDNMVENNGESVN